MNAIDIGILVIIGFCALIGLKNGAFKTLLSIFGWIVSAVIAFFVAPIIANALIDIEGCRSIIIGAEGFSFYSFINENIPNLILENSIVVNIFASFTTAAESVDLGSATQEQAQALMIAYALFSAIVFIGLMIVIRIVIKIFSIFGKMMNTVEGPSASSRFLGFIIGAVKGLTYVVILSVAVLYTMTMSFMATPVELINSSVIGKPIFETVTTLAGKITVSSHEEELEKLLEYAGFYDDETDGGTDDEADSTPDDGSDTTTVYTFEDVIALITNLDSTTLDGEADVITARNAYESLSEEDKALVTNLEMLESAESDILALNQTEADSVTALIALIDDSVTLEDEEAVTNASDAYNALSDTQKSLLSTEDVQKLNDAIATIESLNNEPTVD